MLPLEVSILFNLFFLTHLTALQSNLDYPDYSIIWTFFLVQIFSFILISCDLEDLKSNNLFKRLLEQHVTLCAFQNLQMRWGEEIFCCVQLISDWLNCFVAKRISCLISSFRMGYVNTRAIKRKLKSKTCLWSKCELFYLLNDGLCNAIKLSLWSKQTCLNILDLCKYLNWKFLFVNTHRLCRFHH